MSIKFLESVNNRVIDDNRSIHCDRQKNMKLDTRPTSEIRLRVIESVHRSCEILVPKQLPTCIE